MAASVATTCSFQKRAEKAVDLCGLVARGSSKISFLGKNLRLRPSARSVASSFSEKKLRGQPSMHGWRHLAHVRHVPLADMRQGKVTRKTARGVSEDRRQGCANALREIGRAIGRLRGLVDQGAPPQLVERQRRVHPARVVEVAVDQAVEEMADVEPALPAGGVGVAHDVDRAAVAQQVIELRPIGEFVDPLEVDQQAAGAHRRPTC